MVPILQVLVWVDIITSLYTVQVLHLNRVSTSISAISTNKSPKGVSKFKSSNDCVKHTLVTICKYQFGLSQYCLIVVWENQDWFLGDFILWITPTLLQSLHYSTITLYELQLYIDFLVSDGTYARWWKGNSKGTCYIME